LKFRNRRNGYASTGRSGLAAGWHVVESHYRVRLNNRLPLRCEFRMPRTIGKRRTDRYDHFLPTAKRSIHAELLVSNPIPRPFHAASSGLLCGGFPCLSNCRANTARTRWHSSQARRCSFSYSFGGVPFCRAKSKRRSGRIWSCPPTICEKDVYASARAPSRTHFQWLFDGCGVPLVTPAIFLDLLEFLN
jgi:hypothetical protein